MRKHLLPLLLAAFVLGPVAKTEASLITNGSFEELTRAFPLGQSWDYFSLGEVTGWVGIGAPVEVGAAGVYGVTGFTGNVLELDSTQNALVSQSLALPAGTYELSFLSALRNGVASGSGTFGVLWNGALLQSFGPTAPAAQLQTLSVIAIAGTNTLSFFGTGTSDSFGAIIDDVQLTSVPDGGVTAMLLGMALGGMFLVRRRMAR
jgi:hypothetical protein